jgi:hypothetical protein
MGPNKSLSIALDGAGQTPRKAADDGLFGLLRLGFEWSLIKSG